MEKALKKSRLQFFILFATFSLISAIVYYLKTGAKLHDFISLSSSLTIIAPAFMLVTMLVIFFLYDRMAKKSQKLDKDEQIEEISQLFGKAMLLKMIMFLVVGLMSAIMMLLIFQQTYLYMIGIVAVFFLINYPTEVKFRRDFIAKENIFE